MLENQGFAPLGGGAGPFPFLDFQKYEDPFTQQTRGLDPASARGQVFPPLLSFKPAQVSEKEIERKMRVEKMLPRAAGRLPAAPREEFSELA